MIQLGAHTDDTKLVAHVNDVLVLPSMRNDARRHLRTYLSRNSRHCWSGFDPIKRYMNDLEKDSTATAK